MADSKTFVLVGNFTDNISPALEKINKSVDSLKRNLGKASYSGGFDDLTKSMGKVISAHKHLNAEVVSLRENLSKSITVLKEYRSEVGKAVSANTHIAKSGSLAAKNEAKFWQSASESARKYKQELSSLKPQRLPSASGRRPPGGGPPTPPSGPGGALYRQASSRGSVLGDVVSGGLITQAIVSGFQIGVGILQKGMSTAFGAVAERTRDQLEDIASAGGIFSAARFAKAEGLPKTFQGAMDLQDDINKQVATIASNLPGTTQDFVINARRMTDTLARIMSEDSKGFMKLAQDLTGNKEITGEKAFTAVNVEVSKATTLLEKLNPARTTVPMTQIVEDMMKAEEVSVAGLRKYVSFRRATTFESAINRNLEELNKAGAGTADRLKMIMKVLKEAVPPELIAAMTTSVSGVVEGFRSALLDPDVGLFGLSRTLSEKVIKFNRDTGKPMVDKFGNVIYDTTNFFKIFSEIFGNLGNLLNSSIMPGLSAIYNPFENIAKGLEDLRQKSWKIFERQQTWNTYFSSLAESKGMSVGAFKSAEKAGVTTLLEIMAGFKMMDVSKVQSYVDRMKKGGSQEQIAAEMKSIYSEIVPMFLNSPFIKNLGKNLGAALANIFKEIANLMDNVLHFKGAGASEFVDSFIKGGGLDSINRIIVYLAEGLGKIIQTIIGIYITSLGKAISSGNFGAAAVLGGAGFAVLAPILGSVSGVLGDFGQATLMFKNGLIQARKALEVGKLALGRVKEPGATLKPTRTSGAPKSAAFRALPPTRIVNPQFPNVALGRTQGVGGVTGPYKAPSIQGGKVSKDLLGMFPKAAGKGGFQGLLAVIPKVTGFFEKFGAKLAVFGAILTSVISLFQGKDLATSLAAGAGPLLGTALGGALGTLLVPILGPLGPMLGSLIGGWIGSLPEVTVPLTQAFNAIGQTIGPIFESLGSSIQSVINVFGSLIMGVVGAFIPLNNSVDQVTGTIIAVKVILTPIVAAFQLLEQTANLVASGFKGLELAVLYARRGLSALNPLGNEEKRRQLDEDIARVTGELEERNAKFAESFERHKEWYTTKTQAEMQAAAAADKLASSANTAASKVSGLTPTAADMNWYNKQKAGAAKVGEPRNYTQGGITYDWKTGRPIQKATTVTAEQTLQINQKTARQITETSGVKANTAATTSAINSLSAKITPQTGLQTSVAAIYSLLASGALRVQTGITMAGGAPGSQSTPYIGPRPGQSSSSWFRERAADPGAWKVNAYGSPGKSFSGLGKAISYEQKHKPSGSDLVIANSSETVIPAAGGNAGAGIVEIVRTFQTGFNAVVRAVTDAKQVQQSTLSKINQTLVVNQQQTNVRLAKLETKFTTPGLGGLGGASAGGGVDAFTPIAQRFGLQMTSGYRPGDPGWHGANRARDFSNSTGPTSQMMQFAQYMASTYGRNLKELIYTPLGFSIKNGQQVAPYAQGGHYNHVHVAYGLGAGNPAFFSSASAADRWETAMARREPIISSVRATASEVGGGSYTINAPITIYQQPGQDPDTLASLVVMKLSMAIDEIRNHTA